MRVSFDHDYEDDIFYKDENNVSPFNEAGNSCTIQVTKEQFELLQNSLKDQTKCGIRQRKALIKIVQQMLDDCSGTCTPETKPSEKKE